MKKKVVVVFLLLLSCSNPEEFSPPPADLVAKKDFVPLLVDLKVLEEHFNRLYSRPDVFAHSLDSSSQLLFEKYNITKEQFENSMTYFCQDPDTIFSIYESALDTINIRVSRNGLPEEAAP